MSDATACESSGATSSSQTSAACEQQQDDSPAVQMTTQNAPKPHICQIKGCGAELSQYGKPYYLKKRICPLHMTAREVELVAPGCAGERFRFCHQCGKLEHVACFDGTKRSCRARLQRRRACQKQLRLLREDSGCSSSLMDATGYMSAGSKRSAGDIEFDTLVVRKSKKVAVAAPVDLMPLAPSSPEQHGLPAAAACGTCPDVSAYMLATQLMAWHDAERIAAVEAQVLRELEMEVQLEELLQQERRQEAMRGPAAAAGRAGVITASQQMQAVHHSLPTGQDQVAAAGGVEAFAASIGAMLEPATAAVNGQASAEKQALVDQLLDALYEEMFEDLGVFSEAWAVPSASGAGCSAAAPTAADNCAPLQQAMLQQPRAAPMPMVMQQQQQVMLSGQQGRSAATARLAALEIQIREARKQLSHVQQISTAMAQAPMPQVVPGGPAMHHHQQHWFGAAPTQMSAGTAYSTMTSL